MRIPNALLGLLLLAVASAAQGGPPPSVSYNLDWPGKTAELQLPGVDVDKALAEDQLSLGKGLPLRYGLVSSIDTAWIDGSAHHGGSWQTLADGRLLWRLAVHAPQVHSLDFGFSEFRLPAGAELWLISEDRSMVRGPYTDADNPASGEPFHTPFIAGDKALIELVLPAHKRDFLRLRLSGAVRAYRDIMQPFAMEKSASCNVDTICVQPASGDWVDESWASGVRTLWRGFRADDQIRSVARYTASGFLCTGQLLNQTASTPARVLSTANHCIANQTQASSMVFYWKYESSTCRIPGSTSSGQPIGTSGNSITHTGGATLLATHPLTDFTLVRLNTATPTQANVAYAGWDRREVAPSRSFTLHHPDGDEKRISFDNDPAVLFNGTPAYPTPARHFWRALDWNLGTTEGGSSGGGLYNPEGQLIGVLSGGGTNICGPNMNDHFGRLSVAWEGDGTSSSRMRDHLDPGNTAAETIQSNVACTAPTVALSSAAFTGSPRAGDVLTFNAAVSGGAGGPYQIDWNVDGGSIDRSAGGTTLSVRYPSAISTQIAVSVRDSAGCTASASRALDVGAPDIAVQSVAAATQICGNGNSTIDRGERIRVPVTLRNNGTAALGSGAQALFSQGDVATSSLPLGPDAFGHRGATTAQGGCGHSWIDLVSGPNQVAARSVSNFDDGRALISLEGGGFSLYGQNVTQMVMSTNGYLSLASSDAGTDWQAFCSAYQGSGPRLQVLHDDLLIATNGGLRYRYFASCPRSGDVGSGGQACHVFTWSGMRNYTTGGGVGNAEFQAVLYPTSQQIVYQYRTADNNNAGTALVGIGNTSFTDSLRVGCDQTASVTAGSSVCIYNPSNLPTSSTTAVRVETATRALPALAAGAQTSVNVDFAVPTDATCGAPFAIDYIATADGSSFSKRSATVFSGTVGGASCASITNCPAQIPARSERQGLFYNPSRGGNGISAFMYGAASGPRAFGGGWYTGTNDRLPTWYILGGTYADNLTRANIQRFTNPAAPGGFAPVSLTVGKAWFSYYANDRVMMAWELNGGRSGAELMETLPLAATNRTQAYYNPSQSGWGSVVDTARTPNGAEQEFTINYFYDAQGAPVWTIGIHNTMTAAAHTFAQSTWRVHCPACPQLTDWGTLTLPSGTMRRTWTGIGTGTVDTTITLPAPLSGSWTRSNLPIQALGPVQ